MDQFFTSLNKRQSMLLLTAITFGGQEGVASLDLLASEEGELLQHRAQEIMQIPREKRIPLLVGEIKRLVKDRRGQLWSAEPEKLAAILQKERGALVEVVLRALPAVLAEAVRGHVPQKPVKLTREVRPQVLDIVRWKLEQRLTRSGSGGLVSFKFTDVLMLQTRELLTVCDRLGARVLGPALAGLPEAQINGMVAPLPPDQKQLAVKAIAANAPRKLPEEEAKAQLEVHDGLKNLSGAIRGAGIQRLARACLSQSAEFAARMVEKHRGEFGTQLAKWVRDERSKPISRTTDGGRADIVADLERLAVRGLIERPVRLTPQRPALNPPPIVRGGAAAAPPSQPAGREREREREPAPASGRAPAREGRPGAAPPPAAAPRRDIMAEREARRAGVAGSSQQGEGGMRRDPMAERAARRAGALSSIEPSRTNRRSLEDEAPDASRKTRPPPEAPATSSRDATSSRRGAGAVAPDPAGARIGPPPVRENSRVNSRPPPPEVGEGSRTGSRQPPPDVSEGSRTRRPPPEVGAAEPRREREGTRPTGASARVPPRPVEEPERARVISSPGIRSRASGVRPALTNEEPERPPRVLSGRTGATEALPRKGEGAGGQRPPREAPPGNSGRGPRGGTR
ncbi:MAG TPA: hypothetical protein VF815_38785 [Myxococcaceae bacterium]